MNIVKRNLCKLNKISEEKLKTLVEYDGTTLVGVPSRKIMNHYGVSIGKDPVIKTSLVIGKLYKLKETDWSGEYALVDVPTINEYENNTQTNERIAVPANSLYELTPEIFTSITHGVDDIFIDEEDNAYIEGEEYDGIFVLLGKFKKYKGKSYKNDKEINGVFYTEEDAKKMGDMLKEYGRINDIEYTDYEIHNFLVM